MQSLAQDAQAKSALKTVGGVTETNPLEEHPDTAAYRAKQSQGQG
jgi:hypothetical protein